MKKLLLFAATILPASAEVSAQLPAESATTRILHEGDQIVLEVHDSGNHTWRVQTSDTLGTWTNGDTRRVFNGTLRIPMPIEGTKRFFRLNTDEAGAFASDSDSALLLPATFLNHATPALPPHLLTPAIRGQDNTPVSNPTTNAGATLGRVLFYDKRLSANQTISCASCHQAAHGFSDPRRFSVGFDGGLTDRNSMGLTNAKYYLRENYFWDERAATLEEQVLQPIQNSIEMGMTLDLLVTRLSAEPFYGELFIDAFGSATVNSDRISKALAQFVRSIISGQSKYDAGVASGFTNFTAQENQGRQIFNGAGNCTACHGSDNFVPGNAIFNNGLENPYIDKGVGRVSGLPQDEGLFKVPSLRNIELTAPYMHDGRFATLEQVVDFYSTGVVNHPNLSPQLRNPPGAPGAGQPRRLNLTTAQKAALVAFLRTLTDTAVTTDTKLQDPFRYEAE
ncbi:c-type cytochrome [Luteolibacter flavescens]|uniref:C-type cytochrome n=1 Tax=Luteolibacter flavescens TaxID=1859460 RepID=A0ABT3FS95_9BACT|nr:cytochrome c peroxidase [Luteolibacter flavescens]MCW1886453.1 c-type cytochrome [Luteolibacter flavescens]